MNSQAVVNASAEANNASAEGNGFSYNQLLTMKNDIENKMQQRYNLLQDHCKELQETNLGLEKKVDDLKEYIALFHKVVEK